MRKRYLAALLTAGVLCWATGCADPVASEKKEFVPGDYYRLRMDLFAATPLGSRDIVFLGDSITEGAEWSELFPDLPVRDRGIGGDTTAGVLARLDAVVAASPRAIFLLIGTNDLAPGLDPAPSLARYREILARIRREAPRTRVFVQSVLPREATARELVESYNRALAVMSRELGCTYVDLFAAFLGPDGSLRDELTFDELHLTGAGYLRWRELLRPQLDSLAPP